MASQEEIVDRLKDNNHKLLSILGISFKIYLLTKGQSLIKL